MGCGHAEPAATSLCTRSGLGEFADLFEEGHMSFGGVNEECQKLFLHPLEMQLNKLQREILEADGVVDV